MNRAESLRHDLAYSWRRLRRAPSFAVFGILTLALGIGTGTTFFAFANGILLKPLAVEQPERLIVLDRLSQGDRASTDPGWVAAWTALSFAQLDGLAGYRMQRVAVSHAGWTGVVFADAVTGSYFSLLGVRPRIGRLLRPADDAGIDGDVVVVSERFWREHLDSASDVAARRLLVAGRAVTVVGVVPSEFRGLDAANIFGRDLWLPHRLVPNDANSLSTRFVARLKSFASPASAQAELQARIHSFTGDAAPRPLRVQPLTEAVSEYPAAFYAAALATTVLTVLILIVVCANFTQLLLARVSGRSGELATRVMLGATDLRLAQLLAVETALLVIGGAVGGCVVAALGAPVLKHLLFVDWGGIEPHFDISPDWRVFAYAFALAGGTAVTMASALAHRALLVTDSSRVAATGGLAGVTPSHRVIGRRAIAAQMASSILLLTIAALLVRHATRTPDLPLSRMGSAVVGTIDRSVNWQDPTEFSITGDALLGSLKSIPDVASAALTNGLPGRRIGPFSRLMPGIADRVGDARAPSTSVFLISDGFFDAFGLTIDRGRALRGGRGDHVEMVISAAASTAVWSGGDPLGRWLTVHHGNHRHVGRIVGVALDVVHRDQLPEAARAVYLPLGIESPPSVIVLTRGLAAPADLEAALIGTVSRRFPGLAMTSVRTLEEEQESGLIGIRAGAALLTPLATLAGLVSCLGIYGLVSCLVSERRRDLGIMTALGAPDRTIYRSLVGDLVRKMAAGFGPGLIAALIAVFLLRRFLFWSLAPVHVPTLFLVPVVVVLAGVGAAIWPVRRVLRRNPLAALRDP